MLTFKNIIDEVLDWFDEDDNTGTFKENVKNAINQAHHERLVKYKWPFMLWPRPVTLSMVVGQQKYTLHEEMQRLVYVYNTTKEIYLKEIPWRNMTSEYLRENVDNDHAETFQLRHLESVQNQPSSASVVTLVSTSGADTGSTYTVTIHGETSSGVMVSETLQANGTTPVNGTTSFLNITDVTLSIAFNGTLTLTSNSGAVTLLSLTAGQYGKKYQTLYMLTEPESADTVEYMFYRRPRKLVNDYDIPQIPPEYARILVWDTLMSFTNYNADIAQRDMEFWHSKRSELETAMYKTYLEAQTLRQSSKTIKYIARD